MSGDDRAGGLSQGAFAGRRGDFGARACPGSPRGAARLAGTAVARVARRRLHWEAPGCRVASETKSAEHGGGLVCVPSSVRLEPEVPEEVSEAEFLRASLRQRGQMGLRLTWKKG